MSQLLTFMPIFSHPYDESWVAALKAHKTQHQSIERVWQNFNPAFLKSQMDEELWHLTDTVLERSDRSDRSEGPITDLFFGVR